MSDPYDRQEVESVHSLEEDCGKALDEWFACNHRFPDGRSAWHILLGRCIAECALCGEENDLNPLVVPQLRVLHSEDL